VNRALILVNVAVFAWMLTLPDRDQSTVIVRYGVVPARLLAGPGPSELVTLVTSQFIHGGWLHIAGNMLVLWIFGDNVEDRLGRSRYLLVYLSCGMLANLVQVASAPDSLAPGIGASGAIAGVLGAYALWYPRARVLTFVPIIIIPWLVELPALVFIGAWFVLQVVSGINDLGMTSGGVAWWAHIGGFLAGIVLAPLIDPGPPRWREPPEWRERTPWR
jgi:membrane associated rhomboid family serine protease